MLKPTVILELPHDVVGQECGQSSAGRFFVPCVIDIQRPLRCSAGGAAGLQGQDGSRWVQLHWPLCRDDWKALLGAPNHELSSMVVSG